MGWVWTVLVIVWGILVCLQALCQWKFARGFCAAFYSSRSDNREANLVCPLISL